MILSNRYKIIIAITTFCYGLFIFSYPPSFYNDDSLFLANGILNFSIIDFSPQFPGYSTIIILGKVLNFFLNDAKYSLFILSAYSGILLPLVIFLYVKESKNEKVAFFTFILTISSIYLLNISLSMLSESVGLLFFFLSLYFLEIKKYKVTGIVLAISFFARPSYAVLYLAGLIYIYWFKKESLKDIFIYFISTAFLFLFFIFATNGLLFLYEAKRFLIGHFTLWGTGQNSEYSWLNRIFIIENLPFILLVFHRVNYKDKLLYILFISYLLWTLLAQNPENIRHLIPLIFMVNIFLSITLTNQKVLISLIVCFNLFFTLSYHIKLSPIDQIILEIKDTNKTILSNRSIEILRKDLNTKIFDNYYKNSSIFYQQNKNTYTITTKKPTNKPYTIFKGRFLGEYSYYLINNNTR